MAGRWYKLTADRVISNDQYTCLETDKKLKNSDNKTVLIQVFDYKLWLLKYKVNWQQYHHDTMFLNIFYESQIFRLDKDNCLLKLDMKLKYNKATIWIL